MTEVGVKKEKFCDNVLNASYGQQLRLFFIHFVAFQPLT